MESRRVTPPPGPVTVTVSQADGHQEQDALRLETMHSMVKDALCLLSKVSHELAIMTEENKKLKPQSAPSNSDSETQSAMPIPGAGPDPVHVPHGPGVNSTIIAAQFQIPQQELAQLETVLESEPSPHIPRPAAISTVPVTAAETVPDSADQTLMVAEPLQSPEPGPETGMEYSTNAATATTVTDKLDPGDETGTFDDDPDDFDLFTEGTDLQPVAESETCHLESETTKQDKVTVEFDNMRSRTHMAKFHRRVTSESEAGLVRHRKTQAIVSFAPSTVTAAAAADGESDSAQTPGPSLTLGPQRRIHRVKIKRNRKYRRSILSKRRKTESMGVSTFNLTSHLESSPESDDSETWQNTHHNRLQAIDTKSSHAEPGPAAVSAAMPATPGLGPAPGSDHGTKSDSVSETHPISENILNLMDWTSHNADPDSLLFLSTSKLGPTQHPNPYSKRCIACTRYFPSGPETSDSIHNPARQVTFVASRPARLSATLTGAGPSIPAWCSAILRMPCCSNVLHLECMTKCLRK
jgi:hypothetical protein